jgi:hypothetical protein
MTTTTTNNIELNDNWTHLAILVDRSGSMASLNPQNTSKQLTDFIRDQTGGKVTVTAARFDDKYEIFIKNQIASDINITAADIDPRNTTALYESFCKLIDQVGEDINAMQTERPGKIVFVVLTDGDENASTGIYTGESGRKILMDKITHQKEVYNWVFFFMGTNIDALATGKNIGITADTCINFGADAQNCSNVLKSTSQKVQILRGLNRNEMSTQASIMNRVKFNTNDRTSCQ